LVDLAAAIAHDQQALADERGACFAADPAVRHSDLGLLQQAYRSSLRTSRARPFAPALTKSSAALAIASSPSRSLARRRLSSGAIASRMRLFRS
jgi:hypothetical protein